MASVRTYQLFDHEQDEAAADGLDGCRCGFDRLAYFQPKGDPLTDLLALEQRALDEGFADVHEFIVYLQSTQSISHN